MEDEFTYTIMGQIPVDGPTTSTGIEIVSTYHLYGATGIAPDAAAEPVWF